MYLLVGDALINAIVLFLCSVHIPGHQVSSRVKKKSVLDESPHDLQLGTPSLLPADSTTALATALPIKSVPVTPEPSATAEMASSPVAAPATTVSAAHVSFQVLNFRNMLLVYWQDEILMPWILDEWGLAITIRIGQQYSYRYSEIYRHCET